MADWLDIALHWTTRGIEIAGILVIVTGALFATIRFLRSGVFVDTKQREAAFRGFRAMLGRAILLGLEFLVAADIIATVAIEPTLESVAVLGAIILIRTFLSISLEVEIDGKWPWQQTRAEPTNASPRDRF